MLVRAASFKERRVCGSQPMLDLWRARRARKAAVTTIAPLVAQSRQRLGDIPEGAWHDPYILGLVVGLVTLVARRATGRLTPHALALAQAEAWAKLSGLGDDIVGEELFLLSLGRHRAFEAGCRHAVQLAQAMYGPVASEAEEDVFALLTSAVFLASQDDAARNVSRSEAADASVAALWAEYFDAHVLSYPDGAAA